MQEKNANPEAQQGNLEKPRDARDNPIGTATVTDPSIDKPPAPPPAYDGPKGGSGHSGQH